jgi:hypothetical protein
LKLSQFSEIARRRSARPRKAQQKWKKDWKQETAKRRTQKPHATMAANGEDDDSFSSDSDDEFLTMRDDGKGNVDREALVRKKLLESFYGKSAVAGAEDDEDDDSDGGDGGGSRGMQSQDTDDTDDDDDMYNSSAGGGGPPAGATALNDLDSPHFHAPAHTKRHVIGSSVHALLETEEHLACQVRTLDSSMQTLVYENYSRYIHATDAIRSVSVNVQANEAGLARLSKGMTTISTKSKEVEDHLGELRDIVVEKLRVKRLLTRLDTLLKLPRTLRDQMAKGKYRLATKSYLQAYSILSKHSAGFESLQRIETECHSILTEMLVQLKRKLLHWSGHGHNNNTLMDEDGDEIDEYDAGAVAPPDPPKTVAEIFDCAGTPTLLTSTMAASISNMSYNGGAGGGEDAHQGAEETNDITTTINDQQQTVTADATSGVAPIFDPGLSPEECKEMALSASFRWLERVLDTHHIELQDAQFAAAASQEMEESTTQDLLQASVKSFRSIASSVGGASHAVPSSSTNKGNQLIPTHVLDSILEAATLFGMSFSTDGSDRQRLAQFVSDAFRAFLMHVRGEMLEQAIAAQPTRIAKVKLSEDDDDEDKELADDEQAERAYEHISGAMTLLLQSVRQVASGLALPEIGIDVDLASSLVEQTMGLTEAMVRRRVDQKFYTLRFRVLKDCLAPFARNAIQSKDDDNVSAAETKEDPPRVLQVVQMASVALSDSLQLVDDTVRSILSGGDTMDASMLKQAVEMSARRFAMWLAAAMEIMAGCESSDPKITIEVKGGVPEEFTEESPSHSREYSGGAALSMSLQDDVSEISINQVSDPTQLVETALCDLIEELETSGSTMARSDMTLAIAEMCRVAERSVMENIYQSIATHGGEKRKSKSLFPTEAASSKPKSGDSANPTSERFRLAASRVLGLYAMNRGSDAANLLCSGLLELAQSTEEVLDGPRAAAWQVLELVKLTSYDCADLFGGSKRAGPVPEILEDEFLSYTSQKSSNRSGLTFDVERMFAEKVVVYPHPSEFSEFTRNSVVTVVFKVALKAMVEYSRLCKFSSAGYRKLMVDVEFMKFLVPHFVRDEFMTEGSNALAVLIRLLDDVIQTARERCSDKDGIDNVGDSLVNQARSVVREFMTDNGPDGIVSRFTIPQN